MEAVKPRFTTILIARGNDTRPSDLEFQLRHHCQKLKVVEKLQGAHVLFPGESSLAIRAYAEGDVPDMERQWPPNGDCWKQWQTSHHQLSNKDRKVAGTAPHDDSDVDDFDGLRAFRNAFQMTVVLFILPLRKQREYLDNSCSLFHRAQRVMAYSPRHDSAKTFENKVTRVVLVPSTQKAISTLTSMVDALQKRDAKHVYFNKQREKHYLPDSRSSTNGGAGGSIIPPSYSAAAATHVAETFRQWGDRFDLPPGEADVLMSLLGTLGDIATADDNVLANIPMEDRSKRMLHAFFGSHGTIEKKRNELPDRATIGLNSLEPQLTRGSQAMGPPADHYYDPYEDAGVPPTEMAYSSAPYTFVTPAPQHYPWHPQQNMPPNSRQIPVVALSSSQQQQQGYHHPSSSFRSPTPNASTMHTRPTVQYGGKLPQVYPPTNSSSGPLRPVRRFM